jgi:carbon storage regulator
MLVLTRKCNEQIVLPELGVAITILEVRGEKVRVGVSAPPDTKVYRHEAWARLPGGGTPGPRANARDSASEGTIRTCVIRDVADPLPEVLGTQELVELDAFALRLAPCFPVPTRLAPHPWHSAV